MAGIDKPRRKRGRPPKKHKTPEELAQEAAAKERELQQARQERKDEEATGKRKRKTPTRFREVVQVIISSLCYFTARCWFKQKKTLVELAQEAAEQKLLLGS